MPRHDRSATAFTTALAGLLVLVLGGCSSWHPMSVSGLKKHPATRMGKTLRLTLTTGEQVSMVLADIQYPHVYGSWRGNVRKINLDEVVEIEELEERSAGPAVLGATLGLVAVGALVFLFSYGASWN